MYRKFFKRAFDISISATALIVFSLLMICLAIIVRIGLGGPVIFKQVRPGRNGRLFYIYKFRTMSEKKDNSGNLLPDELRVNKLSKVLRKLSLDELPQLFNILKGDMSLIGPRPRLVKDAMFYPSLKSLEVRPGMSGKSQVYGRNDNTWDQVFRHDADYADTYSFGLDIKIFFLTFPALLRSRQSEKAVNKYYPDELLNNRIITKSQYDEGLRLSNIVIEEFVKNKRQLLVEYATYFRENMQNFAEAQPPKVTVVYKNTHNFKLCPLEKVKALNLRLTRS